MKFSGLMCLGIKNKISLQTNKYAKSYRIGIYVSICTWHIRLNDAYMRQSALMVLIGYLRQMEV